MIVRMRRLLPGLAVVAATLAVAAPAARADVTVQYFTLPPELKGVTNGLDVSPDGTVYFGSGDGFEPTPPIGRLNPALAVPGTPKGITGVDTPDAPGCCASIFRDLSWSTLDNRLYWTRSDNLVGTLAGDAVTSAPVPDRALGDRRRAGRWRVDHRVRLLERRPRPTPATGSPSSARASA